MSKLIVAAAAASILAGTAAGALADDRVGGWVTSFDGARLTLLNDPNVYIVGPSVDASGVELMAPAHLTFDVINGQNYVTSVNVPAAAAADPNADDLVNADES
ncbi:MAG: hypothetical protein IT535_06255 [Bauldia sp.]|nr:hypothetical protein [Bauldia sp.]